MHPPCSHADRDSPLRLSAPALLPSLRELALAAAQTLPLLATTQLCLALALHAESLDLRELSSILSKDPVAVLRLFCLAAEHSKDESKETSDGPQRIEDCLATLHRRDLLQHLCTPNLFSSGKQAIAIAFARHAFLIAFYARQVAFALNLNPERAFLIGLLHEIGTLPVQLGRLALDSTPESCGALAAAVADSYRLPPFLCHALPEIHRGAPHSIWVAMVHAAHDLAAHKESRRQQDRMQQGSVASFELSF